MHGTSEPGNVAAFGVPPGFDEDVPGAEAESGRFRPVWRQGVPGELAALTGQRLQAVELLEWTSEDMARGMVAVSFTFPEDQVTIYNALDENGVEFGLPDRRYTRHRLDEC